MAKIETFAERLAREIAEADAKKAARLKGEDTPARSITSTEEIAELDSKTKKDSRTIAELNTEYEKQKQVGALRSQYERERAQELANKGDPVRNIKLSGEEALSQAQAEFEYLMNPMTTDYGGFEQKRPQGPLGFSPPKVKPDSMPPLELSPVGKPTWTDTLTTAILPRREVGAESATRVEAARNVEANVNWNAIKNSIVSNGLSEAEADIEIDALKAAYNLKRTGSVGNPADILSETIEELQRIPDAPMLKGTVDRGIEDPYYQMGVKQKTESEGFPDLTPVQMRYVEDKKRLKREQLEAEFNATADREAVKQELIKNNTQVIEGETIIPVVTDANVESEIRRRSIEYVNQVMPEDWWTDPEMKKKVLADPEAFNESDFFVTTTPFGETIETSKAWTLRSALLIPNAIAGAVAEVARPLDRMLPDARIPEGKAAARANKAPVFEEHPILFNISQNLGFTGEAQASAKVLEDKGIVSPTGAKVIVGLGFVADLLDPSMLVMGGVGKGIGVGGRVAVGTGRLSGAGAPTLAALNRAPEGSGRIISSIYSAGEKARGAVHSATDTLAAAKAGATEGATAGLRAGISEVLDYAIPFVDHSNFASAARKVGADKVADFITPGDMRIMMATDLSNSISARRQVIDRLEWGDDIQDIVRVAERDFGNVSFVRELKAVVKEKGFASASLEEKLKRLKALGAKDKILKESDEFVRDLRDIIEYDVMPINADQKILARTIGALAKSRPDVQTVLSAATVTKSSLVDIVKRLYETGYLDELIGMDIFSRSLSAVAKETGKSKLLGKLVQVTPNTWADKNRISQVLQTVKNSEAGRIADELAGVDIKTITTDTGIEAAYNLTGKKELADRIMLLAEELRLVGRVSDEQFNLIKASVNPRLTGDPSISTKDFRTLLNASIDMTAEGQKVGFRSQDVAQLDPARQIELLEPMEVRSVGKGVFNQVKAWIMDIASDGTDVNLTVAQRQAFNRARNEASTMDVKLRKDIARFKADPELRALLGAEEGVDYTLTEIVGFLTVNKVDRAERVELAVESIVDLVDNFNAPRPVRDLNLPDSFSDISGEAGKFDKLVEEVLDNSTPSSLGAVDDLVGQAANTRLVKNMTTDELLEGLDPETAKELMNRVERANASIRKTEKDFNEFFLKPHVDRATFEAEEKWREIQNRSARFADKAGSDFEYKPFPGLTPEEMVEVRRKAWRAANAAGLKRDPDAMRVASIMVGFEAAGKAVKAGVDPDLKSMMFMRELRKLIRDGLDEIKGDLAKKGRVEDQQVRDYMLINVINNNPKLRSSINKVLEEIFETDRLFPDNINIRALSGEDINDIVGTHRLLRTLELNALKKAKVPAAKPAPARAVTQPGVPAGSIDNTFPGMIDDTASLPGRARVSVPNMVDDTASMIGAADGGFANLDRGALLGRAQPAGAGGGRGGGTLSGGETPRRTLTPGVKRLADTFEWMFNVYVSGRKTTESMLDTFTGFRVELSPSYLSDRGRAALRDLAETRALAAYRAPHLYSQILDDFMKTMKNLIETDSNLTSIPVKDLRYLDKNKVPNALYVGGYYKSESSRIIDRALDDVFRNDIIKDKTNWINSFDKDFADDIKMMFFDLGVPAGSGFNNLVENINTIFTNIVRKRAKEKSLGGFYNTSIADEVGSEVSKLLKQELPEGAIENSNIFFAEFVRKADELAEIIVKKNRFAGLDPFEVDDVLKTLRDDASLSDMLMGVKGAEEIKRIIKQNGLEHIEDWFREQTKIANSKTKYINLASAARIFRAINEFRYFLILGIRPRFYGVNAMTAPFIAYSTIGASPLVSMGLPSSRKAALQAGKQLISEETTRAAEGSLSLTSAHKAVKTLDAQAFGADGSTWNQVAVRDAAGRSYTYGEVWDAVITGGGARSATSFIISQALIDDAVRIAPEGMVDVIRDTAAGGTSRFSSYNDNFFRLNIAFDALHNGRSLEEASALSREALYDYGRMGQKERWLASRVFIFYTFTRQMMVNLIENMASPKGWNRITKIARTQRGLEKMMQEFGGYEEKSSVYLPDYSMSRPIWNMSQEGKRDELLVGPAIPSQDALLMLASLFSGGITEEIIGQLHPTMALPLGVESFVETTRMIQPEHAAMLVGAGFMEFFESVVGGKIIPVAASLEDGAVNGYIYPLDESQERRYKAILRASQFLGATTAVKDLARTKKAFKDEGGLAGTGYLFGAATPIKVTPDIEARNKILNERIREIQNRMRELEESQDYNKGLK